MYFRTENRTKDEKQRHNPGVRSVRDKSLNSDLLFNQYIALVVILNTKIFI